MQSDPLSKDTQNIPRPIEEEETFPDIQNQLNCLWFGETLGEGGAASGLGQGGRFS